MTHEMNSSISEVIFVGDSKMAALMRAHDWSATPIGQVKTWSESLKTVIRIILGSHHPMCVWWGQSLINFYNDAYASILGQRHPHALGQSVFEVWADVGEIVGMQAEAVLNEGKSSQNEDLLLLTERNGYLEETYFTFFYSPVMDDQGRVGGVFCTITEETKRVISDRRLRTLHQLASETATAKTVEAACELSVKTLASNTDDVPFALVYLLDDNATQVRLVSTTGIKVKTPKTIEEWLLTQEMTTGESKIIEDLVERFGLLLDESYIELNRAIVLPIHSDQEQLTGFLIAGISPRRVFDDDYKGFFDLVAGQVGTAIAKARTDEEKQKQTGVLSQLQQEAETAYQRINQILECMTDSFVALDPDWRIIYQNAEAERLNNKPRSEVLGKKHWEEWPASVGTNVEYQYRRAMAEQVPVHFEHHYYAPPDYDIWMEIHAYPSQKGLGIFFRDITDRKKAEAKLQAMNQHLTHRVNELQTLFELLPIGIASAEDPECKTIRVNPYLAELLRLPVDVNASHSAPPDERPAYRLYRDGQEIPAENLPMQYAAFHNTEVRDEVLDLIHPDGTLLKLLCYASPLLDDQGQVIGVLGAFLDITQRVETETALRESEERLSLAINNAGMATWDVNLETRQAIWSQNHFTLLGYEPVSSGKATNKMWRSRVHPDDLEAVMQAMEQSQQTRSLYSFEYRIIRADNEEICWLREFGRFFYNETGQAVRFIGIFFDTSERKQAEIALRQSKENLQSTLEELQVAEEELRQQYEELKTARDHAEAEGYRYQDLFNFAPDGYVVTDAKGMIQEANQALADLVGIDQGYLVNTPLVIYLVDSDRRAFRNLLYQLSQQTQGQKLQTDELSIKHQMGHSIVVAITGTAIRDAQRQIVGFRWLIQDITERKQIETALQKSTALFESFMRYTPGAAYIKDELGRYLYVNPLTERICDRPLADWLGKTDFELYDSAQAQHWRNNDLAALAAGQAIEVTETLVTEKGEYYFFCFKFPILLASGQQLLGGISIDVTERHQAEIALHQSEEQLRLATAAANLGMWYWDVETDTLTWTDRAKAMFGLTVDTKMSMQVFLEAVHPDERQFIQTVVSGMQVGQTYIEIESRTQWPDGTIRWILAKGDSTYNAEGILVASRGVLMDITERKRAEATIAASEAKLRGFVDANVVGILYGDIYGNIGEANDELLRIIGYTRDDLEAGRISWIDITPPEHLPSDELGIAEARFRGACTPYEKEYIRKDGSRVPVLLGYSLVGEERIESVAFILDLTERKQAEIKLQQQASKLRKLNTALEQTTSKLIERNQELDRFVYTVSHDLKAPLRGISNLSQWIADDLEGQLEEENLRQIQLLQSRVLRMEALINGLLAYSRIGRTEVATEKVNVSELIAEIFDSLTHPSTFSIFVQPQMPTLFTKRLLLSQVFSNLIGNAIKHHDRRDGRIEIRANQKGKYYEFSVADNGPGIAPENHNRVFDIFQTLRGQEVLESTGIGLSIVKKIIETEGGVIVLESQLGAGATFRFTWPIEPE